jgi:hypothetical protein
LYLPSLPAETSEAEIVEVFDRAGICLTQDRIEIRPLSPAHVNKKYPDRVAAIISLANSEIAKLVQSCFRRHGTTLRNQHFSRNGWQINVVAFGTKKEDKTYAAAHPEKPSGELVWPPKEGTSYGS